MNNVSSEQIAAMTEALLERKSRAEAELAKYRRRAERMRKKLAVARKDAVAADIAKYEQRVSYAQQHLLDAKQTLATVHVMLIQTQKESFVRSAPRPLPSAKRARADTGPPTMN